LRRPGAAARANGGRVNRYYDPATGQFLNIDPLVTETNQPYSYVSGDPVNESDPSGLCNDVQGVHVYNGPCTGEQLQQIEQAATQARSAGIAIPCSNVFSCVLQNPGLIVNSFNANRGTIEHAEEAVIGTAVVVAGTVFTAGLVGELLEAGGAATDEGGFLGAFDVAHLLSSASFILAPGILGYGGAGGYLAGYGIYELVQGLNSNGGGGSSNEEQTKCR
jgi:hypothetical protein